MHRHQRILMRQHHTVQTSFRWAMHPAINVNGFFSQVTFRPYQLELLISARFTSGPGTPIPAEVLPI